MRRARAHHSSVKIRSAAHLHANRPRRAGGFAISRTISIQSPRCPALRGGSSMTKELFQTIAGLQLAPRSGTTVIQSLRCDGGKVIGSTSQADRDRVCRGR